MEFQFWVNQPFKTWHKGLAFCLRTADRDPGRAWPCITHGSALHGSCMACLLYLHTSFCPGACTRRDSRTRNRFSGPCRCASSRRCCLSIHLGLHKKRAVRRKDRDRDEHERESEGCWNNFKLNKEAKQKGFGSFVCCLCVSASQLGWNGPVQYWCRFSSSGKRITNYERVHARLIRGHPESSLLAKHTSKYSSRDKNLGPMRQIPLQYDANSEMCRPPSSLALSFSRRDWAPSNAVFFLPLSSRVRVCTSTYSFVFEQPPREKTGLAE